MHSSSIPLPPRQVEIGDAAQLTGATPDAIHRYRELGLLPELERAGDGHHRYGYDDMIRLLWIHKMVSAGVDEDDIRDIFADAAPAAVNNGRQAAVVQRMRTVEGRMGLLSEFVNGRLRSLPAGSLRQADLDNLLVIERIFGPLGAAVNAGRYIALATLPGLREESDRVEAAEDALDDTVAVDDPRVAQAAAERHAFELKLDAAIDDSGLSQSDDELFDSWDAVHPAGAENEDDAGGGGERISLLEAVGMMPYNYSPARLRCMELTGELAANASSAS